MYFVSFQTFKCLLLSGAVKSAAEVGSLQFEVGRPHVFFRVSSHPQMNQVGVFRPDTVVGANAMYTVWGGERIQNVFLEASALQKALSVSSFNTK